MISDELPDEFFTLEEVATMLKISTSTARPLFEEEPGVIIIGRPETMHKRKYRTFRIPRHVFERVLRKLSV